MTVAPLLVREQSSATWLILNRPAEANMIDLGDARAFRDAVAVAAASGTRPSCARDQGEPSAEAGHWRMPRICPPTSPNWPGRSMRAACD